MKKPWELLMVMGLVAVLSGCSGSKKEGEEGLDEAVEDEISAMDESGTDPVPEEAVENPDGEVAEEAPVTDPTLSEPAGGTEMSGAVAGSGQFDSYGVKQGDTLMKIAFEYYGDLYRWKEIYEANRDKISDPNMIPAGTTLKVERPATPVMVERNGTPFMIRPGDTLGTISADVYGTPNKWRKIYENNRQLVKDPNKIYAGFYVYYVSTPEDEQQRSMSQPLGAAPANTGGRAPASAVPTMPGMGDGGMGAPPAETGN
ncbi:MAG: LysM peptidoglycan-binding domain-containing protein [Bdellovibrionales bacterium]|nr:LysM peptidoglycan-binding domain-containing protein [Bdellovibrionales bacterium]